MNDLDHRLRKALCRREPPAGFADRVVARLPARRRAPWFAAVAAALIVLLAGLSMWSQQRERQRRVAAERAKAELIYALQVTAEHLDTAKAILHRRTQGERRGI